MADAKDGRIDRRSFLVAAAAGGAAAWMMSRGVMERRAAGAAGAEAGGSLMPEKKADPFLLGWQMQASGKLKETGEKLSTPEADVGGWYSVDLPSTVLAGLVTSGEYPDLFTADNMIKAFGDPKKYPADRFKGSWWYRKSFQLEPLMGDQVWLYFKGINYRANVWVNGKLIADAKTAVGAYRDLELNVSDAVGSGENVVAVEVFAPGKGDLSITFVDWAPKVPDSNMGLWQEVLLRRTGAVAIRDPHVTSDFDVSTRTPGVAKLTVLADVVNGGDEAVSGTLVGKIENAEFSVPVELKAKERKTVTLTADATPQLILQNPKLWWPWQMGAQDMYQLEMRFEIGGKVSDTAETNFGVRKVTSRLLPAVAPDDKESLLFTVNGVDMLVMGGGYAPDLLQRRAPKERPSWQEDHIRYVKDMYLNAVRLEGKLEDDAFYEICDRYGVMVMAGWCCCSPWEQWKNWKEEQTNVAMASMSYQIRRARAHPSLLCFLNGSDNHPTAEVEAKYLAIEKELAWPNPTISSATAKKAASGPSGVKMEGPYKWEPPIYWLADKTKGGAHGFNTEVGPGACPPPEESIAAMVGKDHLWPIDSVWGFHCGGGTFSSIKDFTDALDARFGKSTGLKDFAWKAQAQAYETIRAMYEGFRRNKFNSGGVATGEIQWMLNNAWPSMIWHLYDYYFRAGGAYHATKVACEPVHILYSYDNASIVAANETLEAMGDLVGTAAVFNSDSVQIYKQTFPVKLKPNESSVVLQLGSDLMPKDVVATYFLRLNLADRAGKVLSVNSYFLSTKPDVMDFDAENKDDWAYTPPKSYADLTALAKMPPVKLVVKNFGSRAEGAESVAKATVVNNSPTVAVMVRLKATKGDGGEEILPMRWADNYFMLLPDEERTVEGRYLTADADGKEAALELSCFNNDRA